MAEGLNRVMLLGNLGADPDLRFTQGGQAVLNLRLATTETYLDKDKVRRERTDWHNVVVWGKRGEALGGILRKGSSLFVEGSIRTSSYDDREGNKRYKTEIIANNVLLTGGRGQGQGGDAGHDDAGAGYPGGQDRQPPGRARSGGPPRQDRPAPAAAPPPADAGGGGGGGDFAGDYGGGGSDDDIPFASASMADEPILRRLFRG